MMMKSSASQQNYSAEVVQRRESLHSLKGLSRSPESGIRAATYDGLITSNATSSGRHLPLLPPAVPGSRPEDIRFLSVGLKSPTTELARADEVEPILIRDDAIWTDQQVI
ncbi:hypothetical protein BaRGS_00038015 [Batillaria attramentaria]|uniref:Uncharacterized protein n=1 Tax=Batillaria attramentaria TaxID=370345 RepID=A0ABD0J815_9CAEN